MKEGNMNEYEASVNKSKKLCFPPICVNPQITSCLGFLCPILFMFSGTHIMTPKGNNKALLKFSAVYFFVLCQAWLL